MSSQGTAAHTAGPVSIPKLRDLSVPFEGYPFAFGYIGRSHDIAVERLDALLACPGDKRALLKTIAAIRSDLADDVENLRCTFERRAAAKGGA